MVPACMGFPLKNSNLCGVCYKCNNLLESISLLAGQRTGLPVIIQSSILFSFFLFSGADLKCTYTADFGATPRIEWKFKDLKGSQSFIYFDDKPIGMDEKFTVVIQSHHCNLAVAFPYCM